MFIFSNKFDIKIDSKIYLILLGCIYILSGVVTSMIGKLFCLCVHSHLSGWVCWYARIKILQIFTTWIFFEKNIFLIYIYIYKINITIYSKYTYIFDICSILDGIVSWYTPSMALFSYKKFCKMDTVAFLFIFDKYLSNHGLTKLKRFISQITGKLCN
jgi:hypothetical protein